MMDAILNSDTMDDKVMPILDIHVFIVNLFYYALWYVLLVLLFKSDMVSDAWIQTTPINMDFSLGVF